MSHIYFTGKDGFLNMIIGISICNAAVMAVNNLSDSHSSFVDSN